jgi:hypothetical protein
MADKQTALSIVIRTVDQSTAKIHAINAKLAVLTKPIKDQGKALGELREHLGLLGLDAVKGGFSGVGSALSDLLGKVALVGGVLAGAVIGVMALVDGFATLGHTAQRAGVEADFLAGLRFAAQKAGVPVDELDSGITTLTQNLGQASAGTGRMLKFLNQVSPALARQVVAAHGTQEALGLLADAIGKLPDAARRAALAQKVFGDGALALAFAHGSKGIQEQMVAYARLAGSQQGAVDSSLKVEESMVDLKAASDGVKAALVTGLAPSLKVVIDKLSEWLVEHRGDIQAWATDIGAKLPAAIDHVVVVVKGAVAGVVGFVDGIGGLKVAAALAAAVVAGPLLSAIASLSVALLATPFGWVLLSIASIVLALEQLITRWDEVKAALDPFEHKSGSGGIADQILKIPGLVPNDKFGGDTDNSGATGIARAIPGLRDAVPVLAVPSLSVPESAAGAPAQVSIKVDIANAPQGTKASASSRGAAAVDLNVGHQLFGGF